MNEVDRLDEKSPKGILTYFFLKTLYSVNITVISKIEKNLWNNIRDKLRNKV